MLVENQLVEVKWNGNNREWFENKGYKYTKHNEIFMVQAEDLMPSSKILVNVICDYCGNIYQSHYADYKKGMSFIDKNCCNDKRCRSKKSSDVQSLKNRERQYSKFVKLCEERGYTPISTIDDYKNSHTKLKYMCPKHGAKEATLTNFEKNKFGCNECGNQLISNSNKANIDNYYNIIKDKNSRLLNPEDYINMAKRNLKFICGCCNNVYITSLDKFLHSNGVCRQCSYKIISQKNLMSTEDVISIVESKNNNQLLNPEEYIGSNDRNMKIKCGSCGKVFIQSLNNYKRSNLTGKCPDCNEISYGEYLSALHLDKYQVNYNRWHSFSDCRDKQPLPFDFYLEKHNLCIEYDGAQHFYPKFGIDNFVMTKLHDAMKNQYCKWNNIDLLRIPYWDRDNIEQILIDYLHLTPLSNSKPTKIKYISNKKLA